MSDRRKEERDEMSAGQHSVFLWIFCFGASLLSSPATPPGVTLATCFTAGSHINAALAPKLGKLLYTATVNAKDASNKGASNIKGGTRGIAMHF